MTAVDCAIWPVLVSGSWTLVLSGVRVAYVYMQCKA